MGLVPDMPFDEYLAVDALSASALRVFARSPWHYRNRIEIEPTRPMLRGTLAHCALLEPAALHQRYAVVPADAPRRPTKAQWAAKKPSPDSQSAMAWWTAFGEQCAGREIVTAAEYDITQLQLAAIAANPMLAEAFASGRGEVSAFWIDEETGLYCKARPDWIGVVSDGACDVLDLKSTADESPNGFGRAAARMGYHLQRAHYVDGVEHAGDEGQRDHQPHTKMLVHRLIVARRPAGSLPFDGARRLAGHVEDDSVDLGHLVGDAGGDRLERLVGHARPIGRHGVLTRYRAQDDRVAVGT